MTTVFIAELETITGYFDLSVKSKKNKIVVEVNGLGIKAKFKVVDVSFIQTMKGVAAFMSMDEEGGRKITLRVMLALTENGMNYFNLESTKAQVDLIFG